VQWFFTEPGAKVFPGHHVFASGNWASSRDGWNGPGEVLGAARPWRNGSNLGNMNGKKHCGPIEWFQEGAPANAPNLALLADGFPECCTGSFSGLSLDGTGFDDDGLSLNTGGY